MSFLFLLCAYHLQEGFQNISESILVSHSFASGICEPNSHIQCQETLHLFIPKSLPRSIKNECPSIDTKTSPGSPFVTRQPIISYSGFPSYLASSQNFVDLVIPSTCLPFGNGYYVTKSINILVIRVPINREFTGRILQVRTLAAISQSVPSPWLRFVGLKNCPLT